VVSLIQLSAIVVNQVFSSSLPTGYQSGFSNRVIFPTPVLPYKRDFFFRLSDLHSRGSSRFPTRSAVAQPFLFDLPFCLSNVEESHHTSRLAPLSPSPPPGQIEFCVLLIGRRQGVFSPENFFRSRHRTSWDDSPPLPPFSRAASLPPSSGCFWRCPTLRFGPPLHRQG